MIRAKVARSELAEPQGVVARACELLGSPRDSVNRFRDVYDKGGELALPETAKSQPNRANG